MMELIVEANDTEEMADGKFAFIRELVRCKDCKHHYFHELLKQDYCEIPNMQFGEIDPNGYCSRGRRIKSNVCDKK